METFKPLNSEKNMESNLYEYLKPEIIPLLDLPDEERIYSIRSPLWIGYTAAQKVLKKLDILFNHPPKDRMPNLLLVSDTNNGKTTIINRFRDKYNEIADSDDEIIELPVLSVETPAVPSEIKLYEKILDSLMAPYKSKESPSKKFFQVSTLLKRLKIKILILDEIHNSISLSRTKQRQFLTSLKHLANELKIPIVAVGIEEAFNAIQTDPQLLNRFTPYIIPRWRMNQEYLRLLASFEQMIPLKKQSHLTQPTIANKVLGMSEGLLGEISLIVSEAAILAIENGKEKITPELLDKIDYLTPTQRRERKSTN